MRHPFLAIAFLFATNFVVALAQPSKSFFPYHVGDRWDYRDLNSGQVSSKRLTRDSVGSDGSQNLFFNDATDPEYRVDTAFNVFWYPQTPSVNYLRYKLPADSCEAWTIRPFPNYGFWAWVATVDSAIVFSRRTVVKVFRYAPGIPCSLGSLEEDWLAAGFGLIYTWREPNDITYLQGCIIAYALPVHTHVRLKVFDLLGREIATLADAAQAAGLYDVTVDASSFSSGLYFYRLEAGNYVNVKKMLIVK